MIDQDLYIEILEMFDLISKEPLFIKYKDIEKQLLEDKDVLIIHQEYNDLANSLENISYHSYVKETNEKMLSLEKELSSNLKYIEYEKSYNECNDYLNNISKIIFKDIIDIGEKNCCGNK
ncbi:cell fate (sporulation/competence/biofilm development) regulator YlbF (YheA/YmcA/DUF963 family) [Bacilli bacterium PM5-3]|nr:cell fate (sporulation/competence/biofilm development) regulator YlbF (YheA/YmcA/DUF963 family) [Bacilli bacterium PM5-3]MDH6602924.1 cell fate (sporulation/competence/biofilm development) regulator YlbF (YheA/YmcA/DUF963 family) [Bacilli bacterium PM5-9]